MNLISHFELDPTVTIVRDANFDIWGTVNHKFDGRVATYVESNKFLQQALSKDCYTAVLTTPELSVSVPSSIGVAVCDDPKSAFFAAHNRQAALVFEKAYSFPSEIACSASISPGAWIATTGVKIGERVLVEPGAVIMSGTVIGAGCRIRSGVIIGSEGFEFKKNHNEIVAVTHIGGVVLGVNVEVQSLSTVARGVFFHSTVLGDDSKLDSHVHVAHAAKVGKRVLIAAGAVLSGSCVVGDNVWVGPNSTISNGVRLGDRCKVSIGSTVVEDVPDDAIVSGNFAINHSRFLRMHLRSKG